MPDLFCVAIRVMQSKELDREEKVDNFSCFYIHIRVRNR